MCFIKTSASVAGHMLKLVSMARNSNAFQMSQEFYSVQEKVDRALGGTGGEIDGYFIMEGL